MCELPALAATIELATDGLAHKYRAAEGRDEEAAGLYVEGEQQLLGAGNWRQGLETAALALHRFRAVGDEEGIADTLHLIVTGHRVKAEQIRDRADAAASEYAGLVLREAQSLAKEQMLHFREAGDSRGEAAMLLAAAEAGFSRRGAQKREEAKALAMQALSLSWDIGDKRLEAGASWVLLYIAYKSGAGSTLIPYAEEAIDLFRSVEDKRGEAKTWHMLGIARHLENQFDGGIEAMATACELFESTGALQLQAFEAAVLAECCYQRSLSGQAVDWAERAWDLAEGVETEAMSWKAVIVDLLMRSYVLKGDLKKARQLADFTLPRFRHQPDQRACAIAVRTKSYLHVGEVCMLDAAEAMEESQTLVDKVGDTRWTASSRFIMATLQLWRHDGQEASETALEAARLYRELADDHMEATAKSVQAQALLVQRDFAGALAGAQEQTRVFQELGRKQEEAHCRLLAAICQANMGDLDKAVVVATEARELMEGAKDTVNEVRALQLLAELRAHRGELDAAIGLAKEAAARLGRSGDQAREAEALRLLAALLQQRSGRGREAMRASQMALNLARRTGDRRAVIRMLLLLADINLQMYSKNDLLVGTTSFERMVVSKALRPAKEALSIAQALDLKHCIGMSWHMIGAVNLAMGRTEIAMAAVKEAMLVFRAVEHRSHEAITVALLSEIHLYDGEKDAAHEAIKQAISLAAEAGDWQTEAEARALLERRRERGEAPAAPAPAGEPEPRRGEEEQRPAQEAAASVAAPAKQEKGLEKDVVLEIVRELAKAATGLDEGIPTDAPLMDSGLDSLSAVAFRNGLAQHLGMKLPSSLIFDFPSMREVTGKIIELSLTAA